MARKMEVSRKLQTRAEKLIPGGVNSPVRAFRAVGGDPPFLVRGAGSHIWDADGNEYIDYVGSWGPLILGHAAPEVVEAVTAAAKNGMSFGRPRPPKRIWPSWSRRHFRILRKFALSVRAQKRRCRQSAWRVLTPSANTL